MHSETDLFFGAATIWVYEEIERRNSNLSEVEQQSGISATRDGRKLRAVRDLERRWSIDDLVKISKYFGISFSGMIAQVEYIIKTRRSDVEKILEGEAKQVLNFR